jgi:hypothetical protein
MARADRKLQANVLLAAASLKMGQVIGQFDRIAGAPNSDPES